MLRHSPRLFNQQHFFYRFLLRWNFFDYDVRFYLFDAVVLVRLEGREYFEAFVMEARFVKTLFYPVRMIGVGLTCKFASQLTEHSAEDQPTSYRKRVSVVSSEHRKRPCSWAVETGRRRPSSTPPIPSAWTTWHSPGKRHSKMSATFISCNTRYTIIQCLFSPGWCVIIAGFPSIGLIMFTQSQRPIGRSLLGLHVGEITQQSVPWVT